MMDLDFVTQVNRLCAAYPASWESGYRTITHNANIGGATFSWHLKGLAQDLIYDTTALLWAAAQEAVRMKFTGIEVDLTNNHLHLDVRRPETWHVVCFYNAAKEKEWQTINQYLTRVTRV